MILKSCLDALRDDEAIFKSKTLFRGAPESLASVSKAEEDWQSPNQSVNMLKYDSDTAEGLLLRWLNKLPEPLISFSKQAKFDAALAKYGSDESKLARKFAHIVKAMHSGNCNSLHYLLLYLREVLAHSAHNGLTTDSLAAIFAGPLTHSSQDAPATSTATNSAQTGDGASSDVEASSTMTASESATGDRTQHADKIVAVLLKDFSTIFADLTLQDTETIPEEQLAEEARDAKAKRKHMIRSNSGSIEKPVIRSESPYRKTMMVSSSADNLTFAGPGAAGGPSAAPTSPVLSPSAPANVDSPKTPTKVRPTAASASPNDDDKDSEKEKEKKGFKSTLRKLGLVGKKDKDKSPSRSRAGSVSSPTPGARNAAAHNVNGNGSAPQSPHSDPLPPNAVFGMPFEKLLVVGEGQPNRVLPFIMVDCFEYLKDETRAKEFGVFRESGSFNEKSRFKKAYDSPDVHIDFDGCDGYTVAALAKEWLRALPECLLTDALYNDFKSAVDDEAEQDEVAERLHTAVGRMPAPQRDALNYLIHFFKTCIVAHQQDNKMSESNVGIVIGPCLHRKENASPEELMDPCHNLIVTTFLHRYETIFRSWDVPKPLADPPGTLYKKALELDKAASVLDDINRKMAADDASSERSTSPGRVSLAANAGSVSGDRSASPEPLSKKDKKENRRKGSGIWERIKEEATGGGRRRSATTQSEVAPFQEVAPLRPKISRTMSSKSTEKTEKDHSPPPSPLVPSPSSPSVVSNIPVSDAVTSPSKDGAVVGSESSPKPSPRESRKKSSSSNLTVITRPLPPVSESSDDSISPSSTTPTSASGAAAPASPGAPSSPTASIEAPIFTRRRSKKQNRVRELSTGSSTTEYPPPLQLLSTAQVELWLAEHGFADLINQLRGNNGKQLYGFTRADLKEEFGLRGVALYNFAHPADDGGDTTPNTANVTLAILSTQLSLLTTKVEELIAKIGGTSPRAIPAPTSGSPPPSNYALSDAVSAALYQDKSSSRTTPSGSPRGESTHGLSGPGTPQPLDMFGIAPPVPSDLAPQPSTTATETTQTTATADVPSSPSTPSTDDSEPNQGHMRYPTHDAPPVPHPDSEETKKQKSEQESSTSTDVLKSTQNADELPTPQIGVIGATPRSSRTELYEDASSSSSTSPRS